MSGLLAGKVWQSNLEAHLKPLAAAMADIANDDGTNIFPSVAYLAWLLGKGERSVQYGLEELKNQGVIVPVAYDSGGRGRATEYRLLETKLPARAPWKETRKGATSAPFRKGKRVQPASPFSDEKGATDAPFSDSERVQPTTERVQLATKRVQPTAPQPLVEPLVTVKPASPHGRLMEFLNQRNGVIANPGKDGKDAKWLLEKFTPEQCEACFDHLVAQEWRDTAVDWGTVKREIGAFVKKQGNGTAKVLSDDGERYTVMGADGTPSKRWHTAEAFARDTGRDVEEVKANWN